MNVTTPKAGIVRLSRTARWRGASYWPVLFALPGLLVECSSDAPGDDAPDGSGGLIGAGGQAVSGSGDSGSAGVGDAAGGDAGSSSGGGVSGAGESGEPGESGSGGALSAEPPSCQDGGASLHCGPRAESCCTSFAIPGGQFYRSYDAVSPEYLSQGFSASVTAFRLDEFEVSVGRFRGFVTAVVGAWRPESGSGKRSDLNSGKGHANVGPGGGNEAGWDSAWNSKLASTAAAWNDHLACAAGSTWTLAAGKSERLPINCLTWYEALAFCIWDEGMLPSEAEWNEAATGGSEQRVFPWSMPATSQTIDCAHANFFGAPGPDFCASAGRGAVTAVGADSPLGDGRWGHADLAGNVFEWVLDSYAEYAQAPCPDCVYVSDAPNRVMRGGAYANARADLLSSSRAANASGARSAALGARCAREP